MRSSLQLRARTAASTPLALLVISALAACSDTGTTVEQVAPGQHGCSWGGVSIKGSSGPAQVVCNGAPGGDSVATATLAVGDAHCAGGGVRIDVTSAGTTTSQYVCNGSASQKLLVRTSQLQSGDVHCSAGGVRIDFAYDVAGTNVFDPAQIVSTQYLCSTGATGGAGAAALDPPLSPLGAFTIRTGGGAASGAAGQGGWGGSLTVKQLAGTEGGHVKLFRTGLADGASTLPPVPAPDLGAIPLVASANLLVAAASSLTGSTCATIAPATWFTVGTGTSPLYHCKAGGGTELATGLSVAAGATLTFAAHACAAAGATPASACVQLSIPSSCRNEGTLRVDVSTGGGQPPALWLTCGDFYGAPASAISLGGGPSGGGGGALRLSTPAGSLWNEGAIDASGSAAGGGSAGGAGGLVQLQAASGLFSSGALSARGGGATVSGSSGGAGGRIALSSGNGALRVRGTLDSSGGDGGATGGTAGPITLDVTIQGDLRSTASLAARGGVAAPTCLSGCAGGGGGGITLRVTNGALVSSGPVASSGGTGAGGAGGVGGTQNFLVQTGAGAGVSPVAAGSLWLSGDLDSRGGAGSDGGDGGAITVSLDPGAAPAAQEVVLFGYTSVDTRGADGALSGGRGGAVLLASARSASDGGTGPGGGVVAYADVTSSGGAATAGPGGAAGNLTLQTQTLNASAGAVEPARCAGAVLARGGSGTTLGGAGGSLILRGRTGARNQGTVDLSGGAAAAGQAGAAGSVSVVSDAGEASVDPGGTLRADGGASAAAGATFVGGAGGFIEVRGQTVSHGAGVSARGGAGDQALGGGGAGGLVVLSATDLPAAVTAQFIDVRGGAAALPGAAGAVVIDGRIVTNQWVQ